MPIRRLNYTRRQKLTREQVRIRLLQDGQGSRPFDAELRLPQQLPDDALVFVEAYRSSPSTRMRFDFGTVGRLSPPPLDDRRLEDFGEDLTSVLFRVKVTDVNSQRGKLLADAHRIKPIDPMQEPDRRQGILNTEWVDLEGLVWDVDVRCSSGPRLLIDKHADHEKTLPDDLRFQALVYPQVLRRVLETVVGDLDSVGDSESWEGRWFHFAKTLPGMAAEELRPDDDGERKMEWVESAVRRFAQYHHFRDRFAPTGGDE